MTDVIAILILQRCSAHQEDAPLLVRATCGRCRGTGIQFANNVVFAFSVQ